MLYEVSIYPLIRIFTHLYRLNREASHLNRISIRQNVDFISQSIAEAINYGAILIRKCQWKCSHNEVELETLTFRKETLSLAEVDSTLLSLDHASVSIS